MSEPEFRPLVTGDPHDDDAAVIESYFVEVDNAPEPYAGDPVKEPTGVAVAPTLLLSGSSAIANTFTAYPLITQNLLRVKLQIFVWASTVTDSIFIADDATKLEFDMSAMRIWPVNDIVLDGHTGPLFVKPATGNVGPVFVSWCAVIEGKSKDD